MNPSPGETEQFNQKEKNKMSKTFKDDQDLRNESKNFSNNHSQKPQKDKELSCQFLKTEPQKISAYIDFLESVNDEYVYFFKERDKTFRNCGKKCPPKCWEHKYKETIIEFKVYPKKEWLALQGETDYRKLEKEDQAILHSRNRNVN